MIRKLFQSELLRKSSLVTASSAISAFSRFLLVTILARYFSPETYGVWVSITSVAAIMMFGDFGITNALRNKLSLLRTSDNETDDIEREYFFTTFYFFIFFSGLLVFGFLWLSDFLPIEKLYNTSDILLKKQGVQMFVYVQVVFLIGIPFGIAMGLFFSYNESNVVAIINILNSLVSLGAILFAAFIFNVDIVILAKLYFALNLVFSVVAFVIFIVKRKWYNCFSISLKFAFYRVMEMLGTGMMFLGIQISTSYISNVPTVFIGAVGDLSMAASFNILQKLYVFVINIYQSAFNPIWSKISELVVLKKWQQVKRLHLNVIILSILLIGVFTFLLLIFSNSIIHLFVGNGYIVSKSLVALVGASYTLYIAFEASSLLQNALGKIKLRLSLQLVLLFILNFSLSKVYSILGINGIPVVLGVCWLILFVSIYIQGRKVI